MLEVSYGLTFFLKTPKKPTNLRLIYLRITVDGIPKERSTKMKWDSNRWDQKTERAVGSKEDARTLNFYLDSLVGKIHQCKMDLMYGNLTVTVQRMMDAVLGTGISKAKILEEFQEHNDEVEALIGKDFAKGTFDRYVTARAHIRDFILFKYNVDDIEFRELNHQFAKDYEFYLKTVRQCSHNTAIKYFSNFKKIVLRAIDKEIIPADPFRRYKSKKAKIKKSPLNSLDLARLDDHVFSNDRLGTVRDIFVFQCYTGLAYIDAFQLQKSDIRVGIDGERWIMSTRQKTGSVINVPLLPKAIEILEKYEKHPICLRRHSVLPVSSNQKMNAYLKEIADLVGFDFILNTHKARRTFGSTVTLLNDVPIHVVKEMLGHASVKQTEEYAITEQLTVGKQMQDLKIKLNRPESSNKEDELSIIKRLEKEIRELKGQLLAG